MTHYTPTPEQFLAQTEPDEDEDEEPTQLDPLVSIVGEPYALDSIATSLRHLVNIFAVGDHEMPSAGETEADRLREAYDDLEAKHGVVLELIEEITAIVKPSTSKLANSVREALNRWSAPEVEPVAGPEDPENGTAPEVSEVIEERGFPAADASIEEWREYAVTQGVGKDEADAMNRSQIRTLLGLPHYTPSVDG